MGEIEILIEKLRKLSNIEILYTINELEDLVNPIHYELENKEIDEKLERAIHCLSQAMDNIDYIIYIIRKGEQKCK